MITKYKNTLFTSVILALALITTSCNLGEQEDYTGLATISASSPDITITADDFDNINGIEADATYFYTLTLSEAQIADIKIQVFQSGGTATEGSDFTLGEHELIIPAYATSATGSITIIADTEPEDQETLSITIGDQSSANTTFQPTTYDFVLDNYVAEGLDISFDFDVDLIYSGDAYSSCDYGVDLDFFVSDAAGFDINDPWATFACSSTCEQHDGYAATGDCPEVMTMDKAVWADGEYMLWHELYENVNAGLWEDQLVPVTTTFVRSGSFKQTLVQDATQAMNSNDLGDVQGGIAINGFIAKVTIANGLYTISDINDTELVTGKLVDGKMRTPRQVTVNK